MWGCSSKGLRRDSHACSRMSNFSRDLRDQGRRSKSKNFLRRIHRRYWAKMVGVSGGFGKGMFWCDFTLDLPKISAKEPFNPPLLPFPKLHPSITNPLLSRLPCLPFSPLLLFSLPHFDLSYSPKKPSKITYNLNTSMSLKRRHCLKESSSNRVSINSCTLNEAWGENRTWCD